jgi:hypothetical protein
MASLASSPATKEYGDASSCKIWSLQIASEMDTTGIHLNNIYTFSSYLPKNSLRPHYKDILINVV